MLSGSCCGRGGGGAGRGEEEAQSGLASRRRKVLESTAAAALCGVRGAPAAAAQALRQSPTHPSAVCACGAGQRGAGAPRSPAASAVCCRGQSALTQAVPQRCRGMAAAAGHPAARELRGPRSGYCSCCCCGAVRRAPCPRAQPLPAASEHTHVPCALTAAHARLPPFSGAQRRTARRARRLRQLHRRRLCVSSHPLARGGGPCAVPALTGRDWRERKMG